MTKIAILGFGTVGTGVAEILMQNASLLHKRTGQAMELAAILVRTMRPHPLQHLFVQSMEEILSHPQITLVVECMGGTMAAYPYVKEALSTGRSVVTSNKELVACHGAELIQIAKEQGCAFLFEASVGGGTPIITPMFQSLCPGGIDKIAGILNGTTNFMLTCMEQMDMDFAKALHLAQQKGYAETVDPSDDVDGKDAARKLAILASMAWGSEVSPSQISTRGIGQVTPFDFQCVHKMGHTIKLLAWADKMDDQLRGAVEPVIVQKNSQLGQVNDAYNGVQICTQYAADVLFYGQGAGKYATANAVVADLVLALQTGSSVHRLLSWEKAVKPQPLKSWDEPSAYYVHTKDVPASMLKSLFGEGELLLEQDGHCGYLADCLTPEQLDKAKERLANEPGELMQILRKVHLEQN